MRNGKLDAVRVLSVRRVAAKRPAYNLLVSPGGTFVTEGLVVHNKGCFLPDSRILRADGTESTISALRPGDELLAFKPDGRMVQTRVREILRLEVDEYFLLKTDQTTLRVTAEHPFYVGHGTFKTVEALKEGDTVFAWDGQWLAEQRIVSLQKVHERVEVFNLQTDHPNTFFAGHLAVHNKGGGGGCFPAGTKIATPHGPVPIETLASGDEVFAVNNDGRTVPDHCEGPLHQQKPCHAGRDERRGPRRHRGTPCGHWGGKVPAGRGTASGRPYPEVEGAVGWLQRPCSRHLHRQVMSGLQPAGRRTQYLHCGRDRCAQQGRRMLSGRDTDPYADGSNPDRKTLSGDPVLASTPTAGWSTRVDKIFDARSLCLPSKPIRAR